MFDPQTYIQTSNRLYTVGYILLQKAVSKK